MANGYTKMTDIVEKLKSWDRCYPGNINIEDAVDEAAAEIARLCEENEKMKYFLRHNVFAEKQYGVYFVCGEGGDKDRNGIPEQIYVCPAYGSDVVYRYIRDPNQKVFAPEW